MKNLEIHIIILRLLKDGSYVLEAITDKNDENKSIVEIFEYSYEFLLKFCSIDNKQNKKLLYQDIKLFTQHLNFYEVGQTSLICEIYKNNYKISLKVPIELLTTFLNKICSKNIKNGGHHPQYLEFFMSIMFNRNEPIKENIAKVNF